MGVLEACKGEFPKGAVSSVPAAQHQDLATGGLFTALQQAVSGPDVQKVGYRKLREREREYRLLFNIFGNEGQVTAKEVAGEQLNVVGDCQWKWK